MLGSGDKIMQCTHDRMVAEYVEALKKLGQDKKGREKEQASTGVRLIEVNRAGHHLQNDVQCEEGAEALLDFLKQV